MKIVSLWLFGGCLIVGLAVMSMGCDKLKELMPQKAAETKPAPSETVEKPAEPASVKPAE